MIIGLIFGWVILGLLGGVCIDAVLYDQRGNADIYIGSAVFGLIALLGIAFYCAIVASKEVYKRALEKLNG